MPTLNELLEAKQTVLEASLGLGERFEHGPSKGDVSEFNWQKVLDDFLPGRYQVSKGAFVIDTKGEQSSETDLVVHDNYFHPIIFEAGNRSFIPAESVYGVFEVKPELNKSYIEQASTKASEVRRLHRTNLPIVHAGGEIKEPRPPLRILAGILAVSSSWKPPFGGSLVEALAAGFDDGQLDLGYAVQDGAFEADYSEVTPRLEASSSDRGLIFFLTRLFTRLQQVGSVPAIDLAAYDREASEEV